MNARLKSGMDQFGTNIEVLKGIAIGGDELCPKTGGYSRCVSWLSTHQSGQRKRDVRSVGKAEHGRGDWC